jgi:arginine decarboxylase
VWLAVRYSVALISLEPPMSRTPSPSAPDVPPPAFVPTRVFFTAGSGVHEHERVAVQHALRKAGVSDCNLVKVSSVLPPGCRVIDRAEAERLLRPGNVVFAVIAQAMTQEPHQRLSVGVGWAIPDKPGVPGYVSEVEEEQAKGLSGEAAADELGPTALRLLAERLRARIDATAVWERRKGGVKIGRVKVRTGTLTQTVVGDEKGRFTAAVALAVYL